MNYKKLLIFLAVMIISSLIVYFSVFFEVSKSKVSVVNELLLVGSRMKNFISTLLTSFKNLKSGAVKLDSPDGKTQVSFLKQDSIKLIL